MTETKIKATPVYRSVSVQAPATVANLVCGFDILGMAVEDPYDELVLHYRETPGITIENIGDDRLPTAPEKNVAGVALRAMMDALDISFGFHIEVKKRIKPGSGLGSSAASSAAAVVAANHLLGNPFAPVDLVRFAMHGEKAATGVKHADNVAPCIYGGVTLVRSVFPLDIVALPAPDLFVALVHPQVEVRTADSRQVLRQQVLLKDAIRQWGNISGVVAALLTHDYPLLGRSLEDVIVEPARSVLIPGFASIKRNCMEAGALGGGISGSGPSTFMFSQKAEMAETIRGIMEAEYKQLGIACNTFITRVKSKGVECIEKSR
jgi:homoserine kinase